MEAPYCLHKSFRAAPFVTDRKSQIVFIQRSDAPKLQLTVWSREAAHGDFHGHKLGYNSSICVLNSPKQTLVKLKSREIRQVWSSNTISTSKVLLFFFLQ